MQLCLTTIFFLIFQRVLSICTRLWSTGWHGKYYC